VETTEIFLKVSSWFPRCRAMACAALGCTATLYTADWAALCDRFAGASQISHAIQLAQIEKSATALDETRRVFAHSCFRVSSISNHENTKGRKHELQENLLIVPPRLSRFRTFGIP
jgi:hypothetical protein